MISSRTTPTIGNFIMSDSLVLSIDFTGVASSQAPLAFLESGLHSAIIDGFTHYDDSNRLYAYMETNGIRHRDSFNLGDVKFLRYVKDFLLSAGVSESKLDGASDVPFGKLKGRTVYFQYTAPQEDGGYPKYSFYTESRFDALQKATSGTKQEIVKAPAPNGAKAPATDEFDFLLEN